MVLGSPGGFGVVQYVVQVLVNMLDYQMDIQSAIESPRFRIENLRGEVSMENRFHEKMRLELSGMGHDIFELPAWTDRVGGVEGVAIKPNTTHMLGGYDPRRNSMAVGFN